MKRKILLTLLSLVIAVSAFCGIHAFASDVSVTGTEEAPNESPELSFYGAALVLNNTIDIRYMVNAKNVADPYDLELLIWTDARDEYVKGTENYHLAYSGKTMTYKGVVYPSFDFDGVGAKRLADSYYAVVCFETEDGIIYSAPCKYSVLQYAYNKLGKTGTATTDENLKALIKEMLEYGAASQRYLDYKTERLADDDFYQVKVSGGLLPDGFSSGLYLEGENLSICAPITDMEGKTFSHWTDSQGTKISTAATYELTVGNKNEVYTAVYEKSEESVYPDGLIFESNSDGTYTLTNIGTCEEAEIIIPPSYNGGAVTRIGNNAFFNKDHIVSVVIPDSVTDVGSRAFADCSNLSSITIPKSVSTIGHGAFLWCEALQNVYISDVLHWCNISFVNDTANPLFYANKLYINGELKVDIVLPEGVTVIPLYGLSCDNIATVSIPKSLVAIEGYAFENCQNLESVYISDISRWCNISFDAIDSNPLYYAKKLYLNGTLVTDVIIPDGVTEIKKYAFRNCEALSSVRIPSSVSFIGKCAFNNCIHLNDIYVDNDNTSFCSIDGNLYSKDKTMLIQYATGKEDEDFSTPWKTTVICDYAFQNSHSLKKLILCDDMVSVGDYAFSNCSGLENVRIGNRVIELGSHVFAYCNNLVNVTIGTNVNIIGDYAFIGCEKLSNVTFKSTYGWVQSLTRGETVGTPISSSELQDSANSARLLKGVYYRYYWNRRS